MKGIALIVLLLCNHFLSGQEVVGLWEIEKVMVGSEEMTPVAKWSRINDDLSFDSGNGWQKNAQGYIEYDEENSKLRPVTTNGIKDPYGPFSVEFRGADMIWTRSEEGSEVAVFLKPLKTLPAGPQDLLLGAWEMDDQESLTVLFFRPDRRYVEFVNGERKQGYWYMHPHRPSLTLIADENEIGEQHFNIKFEAGAMSFYPLGAGGVRPISFTRVYHLPQD